MKALIINVAIAWAAAAAVAAEEIPPFILEGRPVAVRPVNKGYLVVERDGSTTLWRRTSDGWIGGGRVVRETTRGYREKGGQYVKRAKAWRLPSGAKVSRRGTSIAIDGEVYHQASNGRLVKLRER